MSELSVVIIAGDSEQRAVLQVLVDGTSVARAAHSAANYPAAGTDPLVPRIKSLNPDVILMDIPGDNSGLALHAIEVLRQEIPEIAVFAIGSMAQPQTIVSAMRAGAREFMERPTTTTDLLEAFIRLSNSQRKVKSEGPRAKIFTVVNAKGGSGATTVAVNLALALQSAHSNVALVDMAPLGHAALHLNLRPPFTIGDAVRNLHRMDTSLLDSFVVQHPGGLKLLAGANTPVANDATGAEYARLFDHMAGHFRYLVVDLSSRLDAASRLVGNLSETILLVAHADVASLWSASRIVQFLGENSGRERVKLVLNRFRKIPGFHESDAETASGASLLWKIPNQYFAVSAAIDRGVPLMQQDRSEIARAFSGLAAILTQNDDDVKRSTWSLFKTV